MKAFALAVCVAGLLVVSGAHALPDDDCKKNETCVRDKRPTTVIREQNNSPCYGCQPPDPSPGLLPSADTGYRGEAEVNVCRRIKNIENEYEKLTEKSAAAQAAIPALEVKVGGYSDQIRAQQPRVDSAKRRLDAAPKPNSAGNVGRCISRLNKPTADDCPDMDPTGYNMLEREYQREKGKLDDMTRGRDMAQGELARNKQLVQDVKKLQARQLAQISNLKKSGETCP